MAVAQVARTGLASAALIGMLALGTGGIGAGALTATPSRTTPATAAATSAATQAATSAATADATTGIDGTREGCPPLPVPTTTPIPTGTIVTRTPIPTNVSPSFLGVAGETSEDGCGVIVIETLPDSPAAEAELQANDLIIGVTFGTETRSTQDTNILRDAVVRTGEGGTVTLYVARGTEVLTIEITLVAPPQTNLTPTARP